MKRSVPRDLSAFSVLYVFLDAVFEALRWQGRSREGVLCATGGLRGRARPPAGPGARGLPTPLTITNDGASGLLRAVGEVWPKSLRIRCSRA